MFGSLAQKFGSSASKRKAESSAVPPILDSAVRFPYGAFRFKAILSKGASYEVQASTDLKIWSPIASETASNDTVEYVDTEAPKFSFRFYRVLVGETCSSNAIGYATTILPPGFSLIANPFENRANSVSEMFKDLPEGAKLNKFDTSLFALTENAFNDGKWLKPWEKLSPGEGAILFNPTSDYKPLSFAGDVMQGNLSLPIPGGFSMRSSIVPLPGRLHTDLGFPIGEGDVVHLFDRDRQKYVLYPYDAETWAANPPVLSVAESFWIAKTSPGNWTKTLSIA